MAQANKAPRAAATKAAATPAAAAPAAQPVATTLVANVAGLGKAPMHASHATGAPQAYLGHGQVPGCPIGHVLHVSQTAQCAALATAAAAMLAAGHKPVFAAPGYKLGSAGATLGGARGHVHALFTVGAGNGALYAMAWQLCPPTQPVHGPYGLSAGTPSGFMAKARKRGQIA